MPVFIREDRRIYFAHIPKTAGMFIYGLFLDQGYRMSQIDLGEDADAVDLINRYGPLIDTSVPRLKSRQTRQHALYDQWHHWGAFDSTFAVMRDPAERFLSTIKHRYRFSGRRQTADVFKTVCTRTAMRKYWRTPRLWDGHLLPQHRFLSSTTKAYWYGSDFVAAICRDFELDDKGSEPKNVSPSIQLTLTDKELRWVRLKYRKDYEMIRSLGFDLSQSCESTRTVDGI